jgi:hypothetical protein
MKFSILLFVTFISALLLSSPVKWLGNVEHDFGDVSYRVPVKHQFRFKNTGETQLIIDNIRSSCGCTATDWSMEPLMPGAESEIEVEFDAKKKGYFYKKIKVYFNGIKKPEILSIEGDVR